MIIILLSLLATISILMLIIGMINPKLALLWLDETKVRRKNVLKYYGSGLIISVMLSTCINIIGAHKEISKMKEASKVESETESTTSYPKVNTNNEETKEVTTTTDTKSYTGIYNISERDVTNGTKTSVIGKRGQAYFNKDTMTKESLVAFYNEVIENSDYNYYTLIDSANKNKGIVFAGCYPLCSYGNIDETGGITDSSSSFEPGEFNSSLVR